MNNLNFRIFLLSAISALFLFTYCSKDRIDDDDDDDTTQLRTYEPMDAFYEANRQQEQEFELTGEGSGPIVGAQGTKLWLDSTMFMYQNGDDVSYPFTIGLIELYTPKDIILYNMPTVSDGKLLSTDGEIRVKAYKDSVDLYLKPNAIYQAHMPSGDPSEDMDIFYGVETSSYVDWTISTDPDDDISTDTEGYMMLLTKIGWINADYIYDFPMTKTSITFQSTTDSLDANVAKFLYFPDIPSVMQVYTGESGDVPIGDDATVILFAMDAAGDMFYYSEDITISANPVIDVTLESITEDNLISFLEGL